MTRAPSFGGFLYVAPDCSEKGPYVAPVDFSDPDTDPCGPTEYFNPCCLRGGQFCFIPACWGRIEINLISEVKQRGMESINQRTAIQLSLLVHEGNYTSQQPLLAKE
ncbi:hypothetical protein XELAEV_18000423mg [Xenopus laevis]|uniref:Uncharacterized protein n=1 Tax=Xenopus laevis TaxID=8355 RepID=A0A974BNZ4_XENLA|nr:hypothetical protein XELAEV_18000423mg [Xenopus laevis]